MQYMLDLVLFGIFVLFVAMGVFRGFIRSAVHFLGSIIAASALTILPEALRQFADYRMLVYAIVLILVMLASNNPAFTAFIRRVFRFPGEKISGKEAV